MNREGSWLLNGRRHLLRSGVHCPRDWRGIWSLELARSIGELFSTSIALFRAPTAGSMARPLGLVACELPFRGSDTESIVAVSGSSPL